MEHIAHIIVYGNPRAQGSKRSEVVFRKNKETGKPEPVTTKDGRFVTRTREMAEGLEDWRTSLAQRCVEQYHGPVVDGPVRCDLSFTFVRPSSHYGSGRNAGSLKDSAPLFVEKSPDLDKLVRGVMDGLKGVLYSDDKMFFYSARSRRSGSTGRIVPASSSTPTCRRAAPSATQRAAITPQLLAVTA